MPGSPVGLEVASDITAKSQQLIILGTIWSAYKRKVVVAGKSLTHGRPSQTHGKDGEEVEIPSSWLFHGEELTLPVCHSYRPLTRNKLHHYPEILFLRHRKRHPEPSVRRSTMVTLKSNSASRGFIGSNDHPMYQATNAIITRATHPHNGKYRRAAVCDSRSGNGTFHYTNSAHRTLAGNTCAVLYRRFRR